MNKPLRAPIWAAYVGTAAGSEISLHTTERAALLWCAGALGMVDTADDEADLSELLEEYCCQGADDWYVQAVELPMRGMQPPEGEHTHANP